MPDRSVALERTALGWQRSGLSLGALAGLVLAAGVRSNAWLGIAGAAALGLTAAATVVRGRVLYARRAGEVRPDVPGLRALTAATVGSAVVGGLLMVVDPG